MTGRYERLRAAVTEVIDSELGHDADGMRRMLRDALNDGAAILTEDAWEDAIAVAQWGSPVQERYDAYHRLAAHDRALRAVAEVAP